MTDDYTTVPPDEKRLREGLSRAYSFVRSVEINKSLSSVTLEEMISEAIVVIDSGQISEEGDLTSITAQPVLFVDSDSSNTIKRMGKLQRLAALAGALFDETDFAAFGFDAPDITPAPAGQGLFARLEEYSPEVGFADMEVWSGVEEVTVVVDEATGKVVAKDGDYDVDVFATEQALTDLETAHLGRDG